MTGALLIGEVKRLTAQEAAVVREALVAGRVVVFRSRHQWRHFQVRFP